jgi:TonB family protein
MLHPFVSSPSMSAHATPVLALSTSVHAVLFYAAVTSTGVVRHTHAPAMAVEMVRFSELAVKRVVTETVRPRHHAAQTALAGAKAAGSELPFPTSIPIDLPLPDLTVLPDFQPDVSVTEFDGATGIADDVLGLGIGGHRSSSAGAARWAAFDERGVDRRALPMSSNRLPRYPARMISRGIETSFAVTFVIDTSGAVDAKTLEWPRDVDEDFARAVAEALSKWRFAPAVVSGRRVRQWVAQPFQFRLEGRRGY